MSDYCGKYHGCWTVYEDGSRCLIEYDLDKKCVCVTNEPFWKRPEDADFNIQTMTQEACKKLATQKYIKDYFKGHRKCIKHFHQTRILNF